MAFRSARKVVVPLVLFLAAGLVAPALAEDIPVRNWTVPQPDEGLQKTVDATSPRAFTGLPPCRLLDTRGAPIGGGIFANSEARNYTFVGSCGIPSLIGSAIALSLNFTVTGSPSAPPGAFILAWPQGGATPPVSILNFQAGQTIANAAIVPTSGAGGITINVSHSTHVIVDVNGYFSNNVGTPANFFEIVNTGQFAIRGQTSGSAVNATGVSGVAMSPTGITNGVVGQNFSSSSNSDGVFGVSESTTGATVGVWGRTRSTTNSATGVYGEAVGTTGSTFGVFGRTFAQTHDAAGVRGVDGSGEPPPSPGGSVAAGVRGESNTFVGVFGISQYISVRGLLLNSSGSSVAQGFLGSTIGTASDATAPPWGVFALGNLGASGSKHFVEPHPSDASKVILYSSLEGREVGTYFRGTAQAVRGRAVIEVPEDFRTVTDEDGLTVQLTPVGAFAQMYVESQDLTRFVVRSSKDVAFHYLIQGVRRAFKGFEPVASRTEFWPLSPDQQMPAYLTEEAKRRLLSNGTYNEDGTVNLETAKRLGWDKIWEEKARAPQVKPLSVLTKE